MHCATQDPEEFRNAGSTIRRGTRAVETAREADRRRLIQKGVRAIDEHSRGAAEAKLLSALQRFDAFALDDQVGRSQFAQYVAEPLLSSDIRRSSESRLA